MASRTNYGGSPPGFIVDHGSIDRGNGRQIDWANVVNNGTYGESGKRKIPAGTIMGELAGAGLLRPRVVTTNPATCILATDAIEDDKAAALTGYGVIKGGVIYENLLPEGVPAAAVKTELDAAGTGFAWETYADSRTA